ncbi:hypothetical protein KEM56_003538, partial [Ascosphaera pollenicola]
RPDPYSTKKLCVITLTRIFQLTHSYPTLVRELTTPNLPSFVTTCLNQISVKSSSGQKRDLVQNPVLLETVLRAFLELINQHPTIFRPFSSQIHGILISLLSSSPTAYHSDAGLQFAQELFVALHNCAPKNTGSEEWIKAYRSTLATAHQTADHLFRAVNEQWESTDPNFKHTPGINYGATVGDSSPNPLGVSSWQGIGSGALRLRTCIGILFKFLSTQTHSTISLPVGTIFDLTARLITVNAPANNEDTGVSLRPDISKDEKNSLWGELPAIHEAALNLLRLVVEQLHTAAIPISQMTLDQASWAFSAGKDCGLIRTAIYQLVNDVLPVIGPSMTKLAFSSTIPIVKSACREVLPPTLSTTAINTDKQSAGSKQKPANADAFLQRPSQKQAGLTVSSINPELKQSANKLLQSVLVYVPAESIPPSLRTDIDSVAVLTGDHATLLASVLSPAVNMSGQQILPSLMPFLARNNPSGLDVEALLRPRMPVIAGPSPARDADDEDDEEDDEEEQEDGQADDFRTSTFESTLKSSTAFPTKRSLSENQRHDDAMMDIDRESPKRQRTEAEAPASSRLPQSSTSVPVLTPSMPQATVTASTPATGTAVTVPEKPAGKPQSIFSDEQFRAVKPSVVEANVVTTSNVTMGNAAAGSAIARQEDDDSDEEIPTLNIESDSDDADDMKVSNKKSKICITKDELD